MDKFFKQFNIRAFTVIEILIVITVIGLVVTAIAVTVSEVRDTARDTVRMGHVSQIQTALEAYKRDVGTYPSVITPGQAMVSGNSTYMEEVPTYPTPADGDCASDFEYSYTQKDSGNDYELTFCLGEPMDFVSAGTSVADADGIVAGSGCESTCQNSTVECDEECDDGNAVNTDSCLATCVSASCGDGYVWSGNEDCDDGNTIDGDGCDSQCRTEECGNDRIDSGEECDDGGTDSDDTYYTVNSSDDDGACVIDTSDASASCKTNDCGDGYLNTATEECDDGDLTAGDGCDASCQSECVTTMCTNWGRRVAVVIQSGQVSGTSNFSNFPVVLTEANLPDEMFVSGDVNAANSDGGDIRITTDTDGSTELAREIVDFDQGENKAEIWVKIPTLSYNSDTTIYVWYNNSGASDYADSATYGAQNVWDSNYKLVQHLNETTVSSGSSFYDSTSNNHDGQAWTYGAGTSTNAQLGKGLTMDGVDGAGSRIDLNMSFSSTTAIPAMTASAWVKVPTDGGDWSILDFDASEYFTFATGVPEAVDGVNYGHDEGEYIGFHTHDATSGKFYMDTASEGASGDVRDNTWHYVTVVYDGTDKMIYMDNSLVETDSNPHSGADFGSTNTRYGMIGDGTEATFYPEGPANGINYEGSLDEIRFSLSARSTDWIKTEYNNQSSPGTFAVEGSPTAP